MKILQIANIRWLNAEVDYALSLCEGLGGRGHEVHFAGLPGVEPTVEAERRGVRTIRFSGLNSRSPAAWLSAYRQIRRLVVDEGYDLVCAHRSEGYPILAAAVKGGSPGTVLIRTRGDMRPPRGDLLNRWVHRRWTDGLVASGEVVREMILESLEIDPDGVRVVYYGVDTEQFFPEGPGEGVGGAPVIGYVGRLGETKGEDHLISALGMLAAAQPKAHFVLAVKEEEEEPGRVREKIAREGLADRVEVLGGVGDLPRLMREFTLGLVSSIGSEANCRVGLEMMACGVPVVATRVGVIPEVVRDRKDGFIVPPNDPEAMAGAVTRLLKDEGLRNKMARSASERAAGMFSLEGMVERTEEWYRELIGRKGTRG